MAIRNKRPNRNGLVKSAESKLRYENKELKERIEALEKQLSIHGVVKSFYCQTGRCDKSKNKQCNECVLLELNNMQ